MGHGAGGLQRVRLVWEGSTQQGDRGDVLGQILQRPRRPLYQQPHRRRPGFLRWPPLSRRLARPLRRNHQLHRVAAGIQHDREDILWRAGEGPEQAFELLVSQRRWGGLREGNGRRAGAAMADGIGYGWALAPTNGATPSGRTARDRHHIRAATAGPASVRLIAPPLAPGSAGVPFSRGSLPQPGGSRSRTAPAYRWDRRCPCALPRSPPLYRRG
jgi:hypothetical protein